MVLFLLFNTTLSFSMYCTLFLLSSAASYFVQGFSVGAKFYVGIIK